MLTLRDYNAKLTRLRNTRKMTHTMRMVAANRFRKTQEAERKGEPYQRQTDEAWTNLAAMSAAARSPLAEARTPARTALVFLLVSDRGLCGSFNGNVIRNVTGWLREHAKTYERVRLAVCGRRGILHFRDRFEIWKEFEGAGPRPPFAAVRRISRDLQKAFVSGLADEVFIAYNRFVTALRQTPVVERFLPLGAAAGEGVAAVEDRWLFEPDLQTVWDAAARQMLDGRLFRVFLESTKGEQGARMVSMESATMNADGLIETYTTLRNQARQGAITNELIEIIAGAEAQV